MRFLLEKISKELEDRLKDWRTLSDTEKETLVNEFAKTANENGIDLSAISKQILRNFDYNGVGDNNPYNILLQNLSFKPAYSMATNFDRLIDFQNHNKVNFNNAYLEKDSLYDRSQKDFDYTLNLFEIVSDPDELKKYFKDTTNINTSELLDSQYNIKPVGTDKDSDDSTLKGTVNTWYKNNPESIVTDTSSNKKYSLRDFLNYFNVPQSMYLDGIKKVIEQYVPDSDQKSESLKILKSLTSSNARIKFTKNEKENAKRYSVLYPKNAPKNDLNMINYPKSPKNGDIVYVEYDDDIPFGKNGSIDPNDLEKYSSGEYFIYSDGDWLPENSRAPLSRNNMTAQQYLLTTKVLTSDSDKKKAAYGAEELLTSKKMKEYLDKGDDISNYL